MPLIEKVTSRDNHRLKFARQVRDGREPSSIFIEGRRLADEALRSDLTITLCLCVDGAEAVEIFDHRSHKKPPILEIPQRIFDGIADTKNSQGTIFIAERPSIDLKRMASDLGRSSIPIVVFLCQVNNPANLGAVIRAVEAAGAAGVITSRASADAFSPKALRASMGSAFRLPVWTNAEEAEVLNWAREAGLKITASDARSELDHTEIDLRRPRLLVLGSEAHGIAGLQDIEIDEMIRIPMEPQVESLNLAVSAGVILFEARRQVTAGQ